MFSKIGKEIVRGKILFCSFFLFYIPIIWWAVLSGNAIAVRATWIMTFMLGVIIVIVGVITSIEAWQSPSWSTTRAKLTKCEVKKNWDGEGTTYEPVVIYQFKVGTRHYMGNKYDFSDVAGSRSAAERKISNLKQLVDSEGYVKVYYQPEEPELNVIVPGIHPIHAVRLVFGLVLMSVSALTLFDVIQW